MKLLRIVRSFNDDEENFFGVQPTDRQTNKSVIALFAFLHDIGVEFAFDYTLGFPEMNTYEDHVGRHEFFRSKKHVGHIIFEKELIYFTVRCPKAQRDMMIQALSKYADWKK